MKWMRGSEEVSESDLVAYHLHELPPRPERVVARALAASAALAAQSAGVEAMLRAVKDVPRPVEQAAFTRTWEALRPALTPHAVPVALRPRWRVPVLAAAGLALVGAGVWLEGRHSKAVFETTAQAPGKVAPGAPGGVVRSGTGEAADGQPDAATRVMPIPETGFRGTLKTGLYHPDARRSEAPPVHLLAVAPVPGRQTSSLAEPSEPRHLQPSPLLTLEPALPAAGAGEANAAREGSPGPGGGDGRTRSAGRLHGSRGTDLMLGLGATFIPQHTALLSGTVRTQIASPSLAGEAAFHQQFRSALGYRVTLSTMRPDFLVRSPGLELHANGRIVEAAGTYVVQGPHHGRLSTTVDVGAGLLVIVPDANELYGNVELRAAGIVGATADYALSKHWAARVAYRAQLFSGPDYRFSSGQTAATSSVAVSHEPMVGLVYRFHKDESMAKP